MKYIDEAKALELLKAGADITNWHKVDEILITEPNTGDYHHIRPITFNTLLVRGHLKQVDPVALKADCYIYNPQP